jgi:hypothetical protein
MISFGSVRTPSTRMMMTLCAYVCCDKFPFVRSVLISRSQAILPSVYTNLDTGHAQALCHPTLSGRRVMISISQHKILSTYHLQRSAAATLWRRV